VPVAGIVAFPAVELAPMARPKSVLTPIASKSVLTPIASPNAVAF
jgi:hypothetical protein